MTAVEMQTIMALLPPAGTGTNPTSITQNAVGLASSAGKQAMSFGPGYRNPSTGVINRSFGNGGSISTRGEQWHEFGNGYRNQTTGDMVQRLGKGWIDQHGRTLEPSGEGFRTNMTRNLGSQI